MFGGFENIYAHDAGPLGRSRVIACAPLLELAGGHDEQQANGRLIAAAPELLSAAKRMAAWIEATKEPHLIDTDENPGEALRAAIAKAEGRI
jgi:hypothetical protein